MSSPRVSVVLPTHNRAALLQRSIESVLAQSFRDFELIVVDDCSTDDTPELLRSIRDPRVVYVRREENGRAAIARNDGIRRARGEFVAFQDDDDVWLVNKLERQVAALDAAGPETGLCLAGHVRWLADHAIYIGGEKYFERLDFRAGQTLTPSADYSLIATPAWLVRRQLLLDAGLFDPRLKTWDDLELAMRLQRLCKFTHVDEPLYLQDHVTGSSMMRAMHHFSGDLQVILEKQGDRWQHDASLMARHYFLIGRLELQYGSPPVARHWFAKALAVRPLHVVAMFCWLGSWLGQRVFRRGSRLLRTLFDRRTWWLGDRLRLKAA